ncbi:MAG TPA: hypothetical protein VF218_14880 [Acidothermaceae bacterium]
MNGNPIEPPSGSEDSSHAFVVPDDARELARDVEAWRREERWRRRRERFERFAVPIPRRWRSPAHQPGDRAGGRARRRASATVPLIALMVVAVALFAATATLVTTRGVAPARPPVPLKLAAPAAPAGAAGGLLPDATLTTDTGATSARDLRPGVVGVVTPGCNCRAAVGELARLAATNALPLYLVGSPAQRGELDKLMAVSPPNVHALVDQSGAFTASYAATGLTVIPVYADGVTAAAISDFTPQTSLGPVLASLKQAGPP